MVPLAKCLEDRALARSSAGSVAGSAAPWGWETVRLPRPETPPIRACHGHFAAGGLRGAAVAARFRPWQGAARQERARMPSSPMLRGGGEDRKPVGPAGAASAASAGLSERLPPRACLPCAHVSCVHVPRAHRWQRRRGAGAGRRSPRQRRATPRHGRRRCRGDDRAEDTQQGDLAGNLGETVCASRPWGWRSDLGQPSPPDATAGGDDIEIMGDLTRRAPEARPAARTAPCGEGEGRDRADSRRASMPPGARRTENRLHRRQPEAMIATALTAHNAQFLSSHRQTRRCSIA